MVHHSYSKHQIAGSLKGWKEPHGLTRGNASNDWLIGMVGKGANFTCTAGNHYVTWPVRCRYLSRKYSMRWKLYFGSPSKRSINRLTHGILFDGRCLIVWFSALYPSKLKHFWKWNNQAPAIKEKPMSEPIYRPSGGWAEIQTSPHTVIITVVSCLFCFH